MEPQDELERSAGKRSWPLQSYPLGAEPSENLSGTTSATERIAMMWPLALEAWNLAGLPIPAGPIADLPSRIVRGRTG